MASRAVANRVLPQRSRQLVATQGAGHRKLTKEILRCNPIVHGILHMSKGQPVCAEGRIFLVNVAEEDAVIAARWAR